MKIVMALLIGMLVSSSIASATEARRPNVIMILADDLGWADTTLYGHTKFYETPHLERLAARGMTFTRAYSASPLCSPTRSAVMTGLSPARTGITVPNGHVAEVVLEATVGIKGPVDQQAVSPKPVTRLKPEYRTLAEALQDAGYATAHFGKWHLGSEPYSPLQQGFGLDIPHHPGPGPAGSYVAPWKFKNFTERIPQEQIEDRMAAEAAAWIEAHQSQPFFLNYWMFSVHGPWDAKASLVEKYRAKADSKNAQRCPTYAAMIESMDDAIGTLLKTLDRLKLAENTVIVFTADNGGNMYSEVDGVTVTSNAPLRGGKATLFEGGTRVPGVVVWPGVAMPGSRSNEMIQSEDYYPTFLAGLGLQPAAGQRFDGANILPALKGEPLSREAIFQYFPHNPAVPDWLPPAVSVHRGEWKLIRIFHGGRDGAHRHLLFHLKDDLSEQRDLAAQRPELVVELDALISKFLTETKAVVPVPNPNFDPAQYHPELEGQAGPKKRARGPAATAPKTPAPATTTKADADPALQGWKARSCEATVKDGILTIKGNGAEPFLGFAAGKLGAEVQLRARIKATGAKGQVAWLPGAQAKSEDLPRPVEFSLKPGEWTEISVNVPAEQNANGIVRLYVPAQKSVVDVDWIELISGGKSRRFAF